MPLIVFGDGLKNKSHVKFKGLHNEKRGELLLLDIDEYKTSKTCNSCLEINWSILRKEVFAKTAIFFGIETLWLQRICSQTFNLFGTAKDTLPCSPDKAPPRMWCLSFN
ncbi:uncharacterized protein B0P05DRAFT_529087 [Gilbertella persicaria]|uniref:uncharacterized protein n=1 Tax=Gilbertella persicaria TaxID=101096 RepID=UPI00221F97F6|nr:uncharacterized protein B0P05DRAFT_529087 [Gilbertella persicaria]KAI8091162.1 hypothetical protein B0P05DRAFT_529087 [Gilbertella persicaria]